MKLARRYNFLVCFTALIASLAYCVADSNTAILALLAVVGCSIGWYTGRGDRPWALPRWTVNVLMLAAIIDATIKVLSTRSQAGFWSGGANMPIVSTLSQFLVYILLAKLFDRRSPRDEAHLLSLSIFVVVGAVLTSNTLIVGVFILIFAPCVICSAMLLQLVGGARAVEDWARASDLQAESLLELPPASRKRFRRDFAGAATVAVCGTLALATIAFILVPRGLWKDLLGGFGKLDQGAVVGFTDQARLGQSGLLRNGENQTPVLHVKLTTVVGDKTENIGEIRGTLYLRGAVKTRYDRSTATWEYTPPPPSQPLVKPLPDPDNDLSEITGGVTDLPNGTQGFEIGPQFRPLRLGDPSRGQIQMRQEFRLARPLRSPGYFFSVWRPLELETDRTSVVFYPGREMVLRAVTASGSMADGIKEYSVLSAMEYSDPREPDRPDVSFSSDIVRTIASDVLTSRDIPLDPSDRDAAANRRAAMAFSDYLRSECVYDREMSPPEPGEDPIDMFLTRTKRGHCEYFASAFVGLCHSVGLDARYIAGYLAAEFNRVSGEYVVRESNAHAWAEVRIAPGRWQAFDPSPPSVIEEFHKRSTGFLARLRQWYDAINITWSNSVVAFDGSKQDRIVGGQEGAVSRLYSRVAKFFSSIRRLPGGLEFALRLLLVGVIAIVIAVAIIRLFLRRGRVRARRRAADPHIHADPVMARLLDQVTFYEDALSLLRRSDLAKPSHIPPALHAKSLEPTLRPAADALSSITDLYYKVRFGRQSLSSADLASAHAAVAALNDHLQRHNLDTIAAARNGHPPHAGR